MRLRKRATEPPPVSLATDGRTLARESPPIELDSSFNPGHPNIADVDVIGTSGYIGHVVTPAIRVHGIASASSVLNTHGHASLFSPSYSSLSLIPDIDRTINVVKTTPPNDPVKVKEVFDLVGDLLEGWRSGQRALESRHKAAMTERKVAFWFALVVGLFGLAALFFAMWYVTRHTPGTVGSVSAFLPGTIMQIITVMILGIYRAAQKSVADSNRDLTTDRSSIFASYQCDRIEDAKLRDQTRADLVAQIAGK